MPTDQWLTVAEAARTTGLNAERLRSLARRGSIECRRGNAGLEVHVIDDRPVELRSATDRPRPSGRPRSRPTETDRTEEITALKVALAVAEERAAQLQARLDREQKRVDQERARADRLEEALRRPWWQRWFER
jgi:hypothetical protein